MRPILLQGHSRPLTTVKFNRDGDLLFTAAKDSSPCVWYSHNGERLGSYDGHTGAVYDIDIDFHTELLLTASSDRTFKLWKVNGGKNIETYQISSGGRSIEFSLGNKMFLGVQDNTYSQKPTIFIYDLESGRKEPRSSLTAEGLVKMNSATWLSLNRSIVSCGDDGYLRLWDVRTEEQVKKVRAHSKAIQRLQPSHDGTMFVTSSVDMSAKLWDAEELVHMKTFKTDKPVNAACISPTMPHILLGGGQEARDVTTTSARVGHFEYEFYHAIYEDHLGSYKGHFGPVNALAFSPDGKSFASGGEDGFVRLHHFEKDYFEADSDF